jgi:phage replication O-like protein O
MSETSYSTVAPAPVQSFADIPLDLGIQLGFIKDNHLKFDDEHCKIIYDQCLDHVTTCQLSSRCLRVFNAILRQTIGFGKLEDNATTTRLEQLTKIRHDHAGKVIRYLSKRNIIKWRKGGKYNNYLSINFDFASWGERNPSKQKPNNDPTALLPEYHRNAPIDHGIRFDNDEDIDEDLGTDSNDNQPVKSSSDLINTLDNETLKALIIDTVTDLLDKQIPIIDTATESLEKPASSIDDSIESLEKPNSTIDNTTDSLEKPNSTIDNTTDSLEKPSSISVEETPQTLSPIEETSLSVEKPHQIDLEEYTQIKEQVEQQNNVLKQNQADKKILEQQLVARYQYEQTQHKTIQSYEQQIASLKQEKASLHVDNNPIQNHSNYAISSHDFTYPKTLSDAERQALLPLLNKVGEPEIAQKVLDLLKIRLTNTQIPLNSVVAYFAGLVKHHQRGELDFSALETFKDPMDAAAISAIKMGLRDLVGELREQDIRILHYKRMLEDSESNRNKNAYNQTAYDNYLSELAAHEDKAKTAYYVVVDYVKKHEKIVDTSILETL